MRRLPLAGCALALAVLAGCATTHVHPADLEADLDAIRSDLGELKEINAAHAGDKEAHPGPTPPPVIEVSSGEILGAFASAMRATVATIDPSVLFVETITDRVPGAGRFRPSTGGTVARTGVAIGKDLILLGTTLKAESVKKIKVRIGDVDYDASLVDSDQRAGISVIRVEGQTLTPIKIAAAPARAGDWVVSLSAHGKPSNYQRYPDLTLVRGTVAGTFDRYLLKGLGRVPDGTPFVNMKGEMVGIALGGRSGVVLLTEIKARMEKLMAAGSGSDEEKKTPWLGIYLDPINEDFAEASSLPKSGVWVGNVIGGSPASQGGLKALDLIIAIDGTKIKYSGSQALAHVQKLLDPSMGRQVTFTVLRKGMLKKLEVTFGKKPERKDYKTADVGLSVTQITDADYYERDLFERNGVLVTGIERGSPAARATAFRETLVARGDIILEFDGKRIKTVDDFSEAVDAVRKRDAEVVLMKLCRGNRCTYVALNLKIG